MEMLKHNPDINLLGSEQGKKVKTKVVKNHFMPVSEYVHDSRYTRLFLDNGKDYWQLYVKHVSEDSIKYQFKAWKVKQVMILSRK